jgi:hypothetical protein
MEDLSFVCKLRKSYVEARQTVGNMSYSIDFLLFESPFICKLYRYIQQMV